MSAEDYQAWLVARTQQSVEGTPNIHPPSLTNQPPISYAPASATHPPATLAAPIAQSQNVASPSLLPAMAPGAVASHSSSSYVPLSASQPQTQFPNLFFLRKP